MKKYIVICVSSESGVCSVNPFDTEKAAEQFLKDDADNTYKEEKENGSGEEVELDVGDDFAQLNDGEYSWNWTIHEIEL